MIFRKCVAWLSDSSYLLNFKLLLQKPDWLEAVAWSCIKKVGWNRDVSYLDNYSSMFLHIGWIAIKYSENLRHLWCQRGNWLPVKSPLHMRHWSRSLSTSLEWFGPFGYNPRDPPTGWFVDFRCCLIVSANCALPFNILLNLQFFAFLVCFSGFFCSLSILIFSVMR